MRAEFAIGGVGRVCRQSGRALGPGERYHSALLESDGRLERHDYAPEAWPGPPEGCVAHWRGTVPPSDKPPEPVLGDEAALDCFEQLADATEPGRIALRYVLALLLMRRRVLRYEDTRAEDGRDVMILRKGRKAVRVIDPRLSPAEADAAQDEVFRVLGWGS